MTHRSSWHSYAWKEFTAWNITKSWTSLKPWAPQAVSVTPLQQVLAEWEGLRPPSRQKPIRCPWAVPETRHGSWISNHRKLSHREESTKLEMRFQEGLFGYWLSPCFPRRAASQHSERPAAQWHLLCTSSLWSTQLCLKLWWGHGVQETRSDTGGSWEALESVQKKIM